MHIEQTEVKKKVRTSIKSYDLSGRFNLTEEWGNSKRINNKEKFSKNYEEDSLLDWLKTSLKKSMKSIPKRLKVLSIYAGIILAVNLIFWTIEPYFLPSWLQPFKQLISLVVFLTATYNDVVPKTIFWIIIFTFGKRLVKRIIKKGLAESFSCMKNIYPQFKTSYFNLKTKGVAFLLIGSGFGLIIANNFASYSRFSMARNKMDKYFIVLIIAFTISYLLGEVNKTGIYKFIRLSSKDLAKVFRRPEGLSSDAIYILLSGFVIGLLLDAPLILLKFMYGGYIVGILSLIIGIILTLTLARNKEKERV